VMAAATEPAITCERLVLSVPSSSVEHFRILDETLDAASDLMRAGALLTTPIQPELAALRRWLCRQVQQQSSGGDPSPWSPLTDVGPPPPSGSLGWDTREVDDAAQALIAADDTDQIVAVSSAAVDLLGYRRAEDLVGRRLLAIIPTRYRQAHLAGITLHLLTGRRPLLDQPVIVPALRADGSETTLELTVRSRAIPEGRRLFIAELHTAH
jgi:PAS domain S-box-containing protein